MWCLNHNHRSFVRLSRWSRSWQHPRGAAAERRRHRSGACWALLNRARNSFTSAQHVAGIRGWEWWKQTVPGDTIHSSYLSRLQPLYDTRNIARTVESLRCPKRLLPYVAVTGTKITTFIATVRRPTRLVVVDINCQFQSLFNDAFIIYIYYIIYHSVDWCTSCLRCPSIRTTYVPHEIFGQMAAHAE